MVDRTHYVPAYAVEMNRMLSIGEGVGVIRFLLSAELGLSLMLPVRWATMPIGFEVALSEDT